MPCLVRQPVQVHGLRQIQRHRMLDQALDRREARAERKEDGRACGRLFQHEFAVWPFDFYDVLRFQSAEQQFRKCIVRLAQYLDFNMPFLAWATGNGILSRSAMRRQAHRLPGEKTQALAARCQHMHRGHLRIEHFHRLDPGIQ